jgi:hypothetical protein
MSVAIPPLPHYASMPWCSVELQDDFVSRHWTSVLKECLSLIASDLRV